MQSLIFHPKRGSLLLPERSSDDIINLHYTDGTVAGSPGGGAAPAYTRDDDSREKEGFRYSIPENLKFPTYPVVGSERKFSIQFPTPSGAYRSHLNVVLSNFRERTDNSIPADSTLKFVRHDLTV